MMLLYEFLGFMEDLMPFFTVFIELGCTVVFNIYVSLDLGYLEPHALDFADFYPKW